MHLIRAPQQQALPEQPEKELMGEHEQAVKQGLVDPIIPLPMVFSKEEEPVKVEHPASLAARNIHKSEVVIGLKHITRNNFEHVLSAAGAIYSSNKDYFGAKRVEELASELGNLEIWGAQSMGDVTTEAIQELDAFVKKVQNVILSPETGHGAKKAFKLAFNNWNYEQKLLADAREDGERAYRAEAIIEDNINAQGRPALVIPIMRTGAFLTPTMDPLKGLSLEQRQAFKQKVREKELALGITGIEEELKGISEEVKEETIKLDPLKEGYWLRRASIEEDVQSHEQVSGLRKEREVKHALAELEAAKELGLDSFYTVLPLRIKSSTFGMEGDRKQSQSALNAFYSLAETALKNGVDVIALDASTNENPRSLLVARQTLEERNPAVFSGRVHFVNKANNLSLPQHDGRARVLLVNPRLIDLRQGKENYDLQSDDIARYSGCVIENGVFRSADVPIFNSEGELTTTSTLYKQEIEKAKARRNYYWELAEKEFGIAGPDRTIEIEKVVEIVYGALRTCNHSNVERALQSALEKTSVETEFSMGARLNRIQKHALEADISYMYPQLDPEQVRFLVDGSYEHEEFNGSTLAMSLDRLFPPPTKEQVQKAFSHEGKNVLTWADAVKPLISARKERESKASNKSVRECLDRLFLTDKLLPHILKLPLEQNHDLLTVGGDSDFEGRVTRAVLKTQVAEGMTYGEAITNELRKRIAVPRAYNLEKVMAPVLFPSPTSLEARNITSPNKVAYHVDTAKTAEELLTGLLGIPKNPAERTNGQEKTFGRVHRALDSFSRTVTTAGIKKLYEELYSATRDAEMSKKDIRETVRSGLNAGKTTQARVEAVKSCLKNTIADTPEKLAYFERTAKAYAGKRRFLPDAYFDSEEFLGLFKPSEAQLLELLYKNASLEINIEKQALEASLVSYIVSERSKPVEVHARQKFLFRQVTPILTSPEVLGLLWPEEKPKEEKLKNTKEEYENALDHVIDIIQENRGKQFIIHHHKDVDGIIAALNLEKAVKTLNPNAKVEFRNARFSGELRISDNTGETEAVNLIVDIACYEKDLKKMEVSFEKRGGRAVILDHHLHKFDVDSWKSREDNNGKVVWVIVDKVLEKICPEENMLEHEPCASRMTNTLFDRVLLRKSGEKPASMNAATNLGELGDSLFDYDKLLMLAEHYPGIGDNIDDRVNKLFVLSRRLTQIAEEPNPEKRMMLMRRYANLEDDPRQFLGVVDWGFKEPIDYDLAAKKIAENIWKPVVCVVLRENYGVQAAGILASTMETMTKKQKTSIVIQKKPGEKEEYEIKARGNPGEPPLRELVDAGYLFAARGRALVTTKDTKPIGHKELVEILIALSSSGAFLIDSQGNNRALIKPYLHKEES